MGRAKHNQSARRQHYQKKTFGHNHSSQQSNSIQSGQYGFFVSYCASKESFVRNEIYNLLNRFADQILGPEFPQENPKETTNEIHDFDSALQNEANQLNETKTKVRRFQIVKSGTKHSLFVRTTIPFNEINRLIETVFQTSLQTKEQHSRYVERLLPILFVCKAYEDDLRKLIIKTEFVEQILKCEETNSNTIRFDVHVKKSNNTQVKSSHFEDILIDDLHSRKAEDLNGNVLKRDYKKPDIHIILHVIRSLILVSIVRRYDLYKKYNLASVNLSSATDETSKKITFAADDDDEQSGRNEQVDDNQ